MFTMRLAFIKIFVVSNLLQQSSFCFGVVAVESFPFADANNVTPPAFTSRSTNLMTLRAWSSLGSWTAKEMNSHKQHMALALAYFGHGVVAQVDGLGKRLALKTTPRLAPETKQKIKEETGGQLVHAQGVIFNAIRTRATPAVS